MAERALKAAVLAACAHEAIAIAAELAGYNRPPTISRMVGGRWWLGLPVVAGLAAHFYLPRLPRKVTI